MASSCTAAASVARPLSQAPLTPVSTPSPTFIRSDLRDPVLVFNTETDAGALQARQPDSPWFRLWEATGTAHYDQYGLVHGATDTGDLDAVTEWFDTMLHPTSQPLAELRLRVADQHRPAEPRAQSRGRQPQPLGGQRQAPTVGGPAADREHLTAPVPARRERQRARRDPYPRRRRARGDAQRPRASRVAVLLPVRHHQAVHASSSSTPSTAATATSCRSGAWPPTTPWRRGSSCGRTPSTCGRPPRTHASRIESRTLAQSGSAHPSGVSQTTTPRVRSWSSRVVTSTAAG